MPSSRSWRRPGRPSGSRKSSSAGRRRSGKATRCRRRAVESIRANRVALKGPVGTPIGKGFQSVNVRLRQTLELYANLRPVKNVPTIESRFQGVDLVVVRENTEDLYSGLEHTVVPGVVESLKIITAVASTRIAQFAFDYARKHGRKRVTAIHKANIMKLSDGLFLDCFRRVAEDYPDIAADDRIVDAACMRLVMAPETFDVLLLENLYGDIVSDLAAGLVGGLGLVPGANLGLEAAIFEAVHGTAPDIAGQDAANPTAMLMSAVLMLRHLGYEEHADANRWRAHRDFSSRDQDTRHRRHGGDEGVREGGGGSLAVAAIEYGIPRADALGMELSWTRLPAASVQLHLGDHERPHRAVPLHTRLAPQPAPVSHVVGQLLRVDRREALGSHDDLDPAGRAGAIAAANMADLDAQIEGRLQDRRAIRDHARFPLVDEDDRGHENPAFAKSG